MRLACIRADNCLGGSGLGGQKIGGVCMRLKLSLVTYCVGLHGKDAEPGHSIIVEHVISGMNFFEVIFQNNSLARGRNPG